MARRRIEEQFNEESSAEVKEVPASNKVSPLADGLSLNGMLLRSYMLKGEAAIENAVEALTLGADLNARIGANGPNILYLAAANDHQYLFDWLLEVTQNGKKIDVDYILNDDNHFFTGLLKENISSDMLTKFISTFDVNVDVLDKQGNTPLMRALFANNYNLVKVLLDNGANPSQKLRRSNVTPLLFAASECFDDIVEPLLKAGADVKALDMDGHNALMAALLREPLTLPNSKRAGLLKSINLLLDHPDIDVNLKTSSGIQPLFMAMHREEYESVFMKLIEKGADVNAKYEDGYYSRGLETPLHYAARLGKLNYVEALIKAGAELSIEDKFGNSPESYLLLNSDTRANFISMVKENNWNINPNAVWGDIDKENQFDAKAIKKETVFKMLLLESVFSPVEDQEDLDNKMSIVETLSYMIGSGLKLTCKDNPDLHNSEPLFVAMTTGDNKIVNFILSENEKKNEIDFNFVFNNGSKQFPKNNNYISYLMNEADVLVGKKIQSDMKKGLMEARKNVMKKGKTGTESAEDVEKRKEELKKEGEALKSKMQADKEELFLNKVAIFDTLLAKGTDPNQKLNKEGKTALFNLKDGAWLKVFKERGIDIFPKDENGYTPLDEAIIKNNASIVSAYKEISPIPENTLYKLAFYDYSNFSDKKIITTQLGIVSSLYGESEYKEFNKNHLNHSFSTKVPQVNYKDEDGNTALLVATANGCNFLSKLLIQMGSDVNAVNVNGETPLQYACSNEMKDVAIRLIEAGANPNTPNSEGFTAIDLARDAGLNEVIEKIESMANKSKLKM